MNGASLGYAALCVILPAVWAVVLSSGLSAWERRRDRNKGPPPPVDYSI